MFFLIKQFFARQECNSFQAAVSLRSYDPSWLITSLSVIFFFFKEIFRLASDLTEYSFFIFSSYMDSNLSSFLRKICVETNN